MHLRNLMLVWALAMLSPANALSTCSLFRSQPIQTIDFCQTCIVRTADERALERIKGALLSQTQIKIHVAGCLGRCNTEGVTFVVDGRIIPDMEIDKLLKLDLDSLLDELIRRSNES